MRTPSFTRGTRVACLSLLILALFRLSSDAQQGGRAKLPFDVAERQLRIDEGGLAVTFDQYWMVAGALQVHRRTDGMVWVVSASGLHRHDGYDVRYFHDPWDNPEGRMLSYLTCGAEDEEGTFWLGARHGFKEFDDRTGTFKSFLSDPANPTSISNNTVLSVCPDGRGNVWVGTVHGLNRFERATRDFHRYFHSSGDPTSLLCDTIPRMVVGKDGKVWTGSRYGISAYDPATGRFVNYTTNTPLPFRLPRNEVNCLYVAENGCLWIGTPAGISVLDFARGTNRLYPVRSSDTIALQDSVVTCLAEDGLGNVWVGTMSHGLVRLEPATGKFTSYLKAEVARPFSAQGNRGYFAASQMRSILHIAADPDGRRGGAGEPAILWVIGDGAVWRVAVARQRFLDVTARNARAWVGRLRPASSVPIIPISDRYVWVGTLSGSIARIDLWTLRMTELQVKWPAGNPLMLTGAVLAADGATWLALANGMYRFDPGRKALEPIPGAERVGPGLLARDGNLWFPTMKMEGSVPYLIRFDTTTGRFIRYDRERLRGEGRAGGSVVSILEDRRGEIWFGTFGKGLFRFDPRTGLYTQYTSAEGAKGTLKTSIVRALLLDSAGVIWVGTDSGLHRYIPETDCFERYLTTGREANDQGHFIRWLSIDRKQDLWLAHSTGISRFDRAHGRFRDFAEVDGLKRTQYARLAFEPHSGIMYAFDIAGSIVAFRPEELPLASAGGKVIITEFRVFENPVPLPEPIYRIHEVTLSPGENFFSFRFSALEFLRTEKINYQYKMEGFDRDWVQAGSRAYAGYTNLDHGKYVFRVRATDPDGVWSDSVTAMSVVILPPWWKTSWAYGLFVLLIVSALYAAWQYDRRRVRLRHELEMKDFQTRKLLEVDQLKTRFFANISHECRTPLTLILGPAEKLRSRLEDRDVRRDLETIERNANGLLALINQILYLSKLDAGHMALRVSPVEIVPLVKRFVESFASLADRKNIALVFESSEAGLVVHVDQEKLEKILGNLLSNAFKFTEDGGKIVVTLRRCCGNLEGEDKGEGEAQGAGWVEISVADSGIGIPEEKLEKVFDRFYQVDSSSTRTRSGTGIGLALAKELVELHRGYIRVTSKVGEGTTFVVGLPFGREKYTGDQIVEPCPGSGRAGVSAMVPGEEWAAEEGAPEGVSGPASAPIVLIVEDNAELRRYVRECLEQGYRVAEAADGVEGLERALSSMPDLVITDIMMPRMDGIELCRRLKSDERTSHIPLILLTARASGESKVEALETGADDYIVKPFDARELMVRVRNLIETRRALREKFRENIVLEPAEIPIASGDAKFLQRLMEAIERHMAEPECDTEMLAREVCMSRMQLNRKLHALTGHSTHEFLRVQRLKRGAQLLRHHGENVSQVAYDVGFASPSHFAQAFKAQFGMSPSEYAEQHSEGPPGP